MDCGKCHGHKHKRHSLNSHLNTYLAANYEVVGLAVNVNQSLTPTLLSSHPSEKTLFWTCNRNQNVVQTKTLKPFVLGLFSKMHFPCEILFLITA